MPQKKLKSVHEVASPPEITTKMNLEEDKPEDDTFEEYSSPSQKVQTKRLETTKNEYGFQQSPVSVKVHSSEPRLMKAKFTAVQERSEENHVNDSISTPNQLDVRTSHAALMPNTTPQRRTQDELRTGRKVKLAVNCIGKC